MMCAVVARAALMRSAGGAAHLGTDPPAGNIDFRLGQHALIKHGGVLLFHAHRVAAAPDIAGHLVDIGHMNRGRRSSPTLRAAAFRSSSAAATGMTKTK